MGMGRLPRYVFSLFASLACLATAARRRDVLRWIKAKAVPGRHHPQNF
jgi:hypothetical protein